MLNPWMYIKSEAGTKEYAEESLRFFLSEGEDAEIRCDSGWYYVEFKDLNFDKNRINK
jgi:hypothetical protein